MAPFFRLNKDINIQDTSQNLRKIYTARSANNPMKSKCKPKNL